ncbi:MAG: hypothetical protein ACE5I1_04180, partial [bacterium]
AQAQRDSRKTAKRKISLSASFQYQNVPHRLDIKSYGLSFEYFVIDSLAYSENNREGFSRPMHYSISFSGPIYYGRGSNSTDYIHLPVGGSVLLVYLAYAYLVGQGSESHFTAAPNSNDNNSVLYGLPIERALLFLITENVNFNFAVSDRFMLSPYLSLFAVDIAVNKNESVTTGQKQIGNLWSVGAGLNIKTFLAERLAVVPYISYKYFFLSGERKGYSTEMHLAYNF